MSKIHNSCLKNIYIHDDYDRIMWHSDVALYVTSILQLSKFLGVMESQGLIQVVEQSQGVQTITDVNFKHPLYVCRKLSIQ